MPRRREDFIDAFAAYGDLRETPKGSNRAPRIDAMLTRIGSPLSSAWCAALQHQVGFDVFGKEWPFRQSGRVQDIVDACKKQGRTVSVKEAKVGDLIVFYFPKLKRYAHIAVLRHPVIARVRTIDGNTIEDGASGDSREGWGVFLKNRALDTKRMLALTYPEGFFDG